jgi:hypothetical protein
VELADLQAAGLEADFLAPPCLYFPP